MNDKPWNKAMMSLVNNESFFTEKILAKNKLWYLALSFYPCVPLEFP